MDYYTRVNCGVCGGRIVVETVIPYIPRSDPRAFGPGSENTATEADRMITGFHCAICGIVYKDVGQFDEVRQRIRESARNTKKTQRVEIDPDTFEKIVTATKTGK